jgi:hypothetical protein
MSPTAEAPICAKNIHNEYEQWVEHVAESGSKNWRYMQLLLGCREVGFSFDPF